MDWIAEYNHYWPIYWKEIEMKWTDNGGGQDFQQAPAGTQEAICTGVIDLGTQEGEWQGKPLIRRQVLVQWELPTCPMDDGQPFIVSKFYTASLNEKANLRRDLESWRGRPFTEAELAGFESKNIIGKPCLLSIIHNEAGKARVSGVMAVPKGMTVPKQHNPNIHFSMEHGEFSAETFEKVGKGLQDIIRKSPEYQEAVGKGHPERDFDEEAGSIPF